MNKFDDLVAMVLDRMKEPANVVAHSMGGLIAIKVALAAPEQVKRLGLAATSAGVPIADLGGSDWRPDYYLAFPHAPERVADLSPQPGSNEAPTLLHWGDRDPISPVSGSGCGHFFQTRAFTLFLARIMTSPKPIRVCCKPDRGTLDNNVVTSGLEKEADGHISVLRAH